MSLLETSSLAETVDRLAEALFQGRPLAHLRCDPAVLWIAGRQGLPGSYHGMFAPTRDDFGAGIRLFTGERISSKAATAHILGEEACRALILVASSLSVARRAVQAASEAFLPAWHSYPAMYRAGMYCCGPCSVALWRHIAAGGLPKESGRLARGLQSLRAHRTGGGRWRRFPDFYTLLALTEIGLPAARSELHYAAPRCERYLKRKPTPDRYAQRRGQVAEGVLALA